MWLFLPATKGDLNLRMGLTLGMGSKPIRSTTGVKKKGLGRTCSCRGGGVWYGGVESQGGGDWGAVIWRQKPKRGCGAVTDSKICVVGVRGTGAGKPRRKPKGNAGSLEIGGWGKKDWVKRGTPEGDAVTGGKNRGRCIGSVGQKGLRPQPGRCKTCGRIRCAGKSEGSSTNRPIQ